MNVQFNTSEFAPAQATAEEVAALRQQLDSLAERVRSLEAQLDVRPVPAPKAEILPCRWCRKTTGGHEVYCYAHPGNE